ncbi:35507_t:CDS:1, partial [Gigaspora margarita]
SYDDFDDNAEPYTQVLHINIIKFFDSFIDHVEVINKNENDKLIAYQIINLTSKADGFTYIYHLRDKLKD